MVDEVGVQKIEYRRKIFAMRQIRDSVAGSDAVKRSGELYAPMPSGMRDVPAVTTQELSQSNMLADRSLARADAPWHHANPAYSAYIHRGKFPDITANTLRGLVGVATKRLPDVEVPTQLKYLEEVCTLSGDNIYQLYKNCVSEVLQVGRCCLVLDVRSDNTLYIAEYDSESYINWKFEVINGQKVQTYAEFETVYYEENEQHKKTLVYFLDQEEENGKFFCFTQKHKDGNPVSEPVKILIQGKPIERLPVVNIGAFENVPDLESLPLIGVSDCAMDIYRHSCDLNQAHFMSCNPTLVFIGVEEDDAPRALGSTVAICLSNYQADAKYLTTDTTALTHVANYIKGVFDEAVSYGASLLGGRSVESGEAISLRQAASGATLVGVVQNVAEGIEKLLNIAGMFTGAGESEFLPNVEFAEAKLTAEEINALVKTWMLNGMSKMSMLENLSAAGYLRERTPQEELDLIEQEMDSLPKEPAAPVKPPAEPPVKEDGDVVDV